MFVHIFKYTLEMIEMFDLKTIQSSLFFASNYKKMVNRSKCLAAVTS